jgi:hypothetical protein
MINPLKFFLLLFLLSIICIKTSFAQEPGEPFNPETAYGANYIHATGHRLLWQNPDSTIYNIIYFSEDSSLVAQLDSSVVLYDGTPTTVYDTIYLTSVEPIGWNKKYYWRIVEFYNFGSMEGPIWSFQTMENPICEYEVFFDDFESGLNNWIVTNNGGTCVWEVFYPPYPNMYTLPFTSSGGVLAADADECGSGTTTLSTITLTTPLGNGQYYKILEFDNDWNAIDSEDAAYVEVSADGGVTWEIVWSKVGIDWRDTHEVILIGYYVEILVRFRSVQPGWDWWWAIDNVRLVQDCPLTQFYPPHNLLLNTISEPTPKVELSWSKLGPFGSGFLIERKIGLPNDSTTYSTIGQVDYSVTNFIDSTVVKNQTYTFRIHGIPYLDTGPSNEATAYVPDIITSVETKDELLLEFLLEQNYPNPFNPTTIIRFTISDVRFTTLQVYDVLGREITTLINEEKPPGSYEVEFNAEGLTSGIYFYQLRSGNFVKTKKMILMK